VIGATTRWQRLSIFAGAAFIACIFFDYGFAQVWPMTQGLPVASALLFGASWLIGLWRAPFGWLGFLWSLVISLLMPFLAMIAVIAALCYIGPECM
jgi:hypothetical protein